MTLLFTEEHEWLQVDGDLVTIGISEFAQDQLGDIVFIELPEVDQEISQGDEVAVIESVKAAGEIKAPVSGVVVEINETLADAPETVNQDPTGTGWFFRVRVEAVVIPGDFLGEDEYQTFLDEQ